MDNLRTLRIALFLILLLVNRNTGFSQPAERIIKIIIAPDHSDWLYKPGENVKFSISVIKDGNPVKNVNVRYEIGPEKMEPYKKDSLNLGNGILTVDGGTLKTPGFLRCTVAAKVEGKEYKQMATAGFDPLDIKPTIENPADFLRFWNDAKNELAKIPLDVKMLLLPERCTEKVNVYHADIQNFRTNSRLYGILCIPKKEGKYPALLTVPGAGVRPYGGNISMAEKGLITFDIGIHGIPVTMDEDIYYDLGAGALRGYQNYNLDDRDRFYYKRVYLGCVRAGDFIFSLPQFDGSNLAVTGGSQGGALSIVAAALDPRIKYLAAYYPALCDVTGYLKGRAGGWPHYFDKNNIDFNNKKDKIETCGYYDVVNFARQIKVPGMYTWGFNDDVCPPTSMYAAYNVISAPKSLYLSLETGHWTFPEQEENLDNWLLEKLQVNK
jgi:cephalosporin-C deacetylase-like acetyl esterase